MPEDLPPRKEGSDPSVTELLHLAQKMTTNAFLIIVYM
jgi:hypothetical protein